MGPVAVAGTVQRVAVRQRHVIRSGIILAGEIPAIDLVGGKRALLHFRGVVGLIGLLRAGSPKHGVRVVQPGIDHCDSHALPIVAGGSRSPSRLCADGRHAFRGERLIYPQPLDPFHISPLAQGGHRFGSNTNPQGVDQSRVTPGHPGTVGLEPLGHCFLLVGQAFGLTFHCLTKCSAIEAGLFLIEIKRNQRLALKLHQHRQSQRRLDRLSQGQACY